MNPKLVKQAVAFAAEFSEQNNERIVVLVNEQNENLLRNKVLSLLSSPFHHFR